MLRNYLTNKWILAGAAFLILFSFACYLWYQHDTAPDRQEAAKTAGLLRQWEETPSTDTHRETEQVADITTSDSISQTPKKLITTDAEMREATPDQHKTAIVETIEQAHVSPHGFGAYPKIPDGWNQGFFDRELSREHELLARVRIKLFEQGSSAISVAIDKATGLVYPIEKNSVYITWGETSLPDLGVVKYIADILGDATVLQQIESNARSRDPNTPIPLQIETDIPAGVQMLSESEGFDPYAFLNLKGNSYNLI